AFLMGQTRRLPPDVLGSVLPREQFLLYLGRLDRVRQGVLLEGLYHQIGWEGDRARCQLVLAEAARRQADIPLCRKYVDAASPWILHSGSVEHLCLLHLTVGRLRRSEHNLQAAHRAVAEGLHLARRCGLGLSYIDLLCEQAEVCLAEETPGPAAEAADEAWQRALAPVCLFQWGAALAGHLLGLAQAR